MSLVLLFIFVGFFFVMEVITKKEIWSKLAIAFVLATFIVALLALISAVVSLVMFLSAL